MRTLPSKSQRDIVFARDIARLFPDQGTWNPEEYFHLEDLRGGGTRIEYDNGRLEFLPMPTRSHQRIIRFLLTMLLAYTEEHAPGEVLFSGMRVRLRIGRKVKFREPDLVYMRARNLHRCHEDFWDGADLVMEVVSGSPEDRDRDLVVKVREYAAAGIPEYWIIDLERRRILVLTRKGRSYRVRGEYQAGEQATSALLRGFRISVTQIFAAAEDKQS